MSAILRQVIWNKIFESFLVWTACLTIYSGMHIVWNVPWSTAGFAIFAFLPALITTIGNSGATGVIEFLRSTSRTSIGFFKGLFLYDVVLFGLNCVLLLLANAVIGDGYIESFVFSWPISLAIIFGVIQLVLLVQGYTPRAQTIVLQRPSFWQVILFILVYAGIIALCFVFAYSADAGLAAINLVLIYSVFESTIMRSNFPRELRIKICCVLAGFAVGVGAVGVSLNGWGLVNPPISSKMARELAKAEFTKKYGDLMSTSYEYLYDLEGENWRITGLKGEFVEIFVNSKTGEMSPATPKVKPKKDE